MLKHMFKTGSSLLSYGLRCRCVKVRQRIRIFVDLREKNFPLGKIPGGGGCVIPQAGLVFFNGRTCLLVQF
jgi:hypothetical protein